MKATGNHVCISALAHWLNALRFHDAKLLQRVLHAWSAAARAARERKAALAISNADDNVLARQLSPSYNIAVKKHTQTVEKSRWSRISSCAERRAMQTRRPRTAMSQQLNLSNVVCIKACFHWLAVTSESKQQYAWRLSANDAALWHCDRVVRRYLIGKFQLRCDADAVSQLLYAHALVNAQLVTATFRAWAAVVRTVRKARVVVAKLRARRCLRIWSAVTLQQLRSLRSCLDVWQQAVQRARHRAAAAIAATAIHSISTQRVAWTQWRAVATVALAVRFVQRVWRGKLGRKAAAAAQQQKLIQRAAQYYARRLRMHHAGSAIQYWCVYTGAQQQYRAVYNVAVEQDKKKAQLGAISRWKQRTQQQAAVAAAVQRSAKAQAVNAIVLWKQVARKSKHNSTSIATAAAYQRHCPLSSAIVVWKRDAKRTRNNAELCAIVLSYSRLRALTTGLQQWQHQWQQQRTYAEQLLQHSQHVHTVLAAVQKRVQRQALSAWRSRTTALHTQHSAAQQRQAVVVSSCTKRALQRTKQQIAAAAAHRKRIHKALVHRRISTLTAALSQWHSAHVLLRRQRTTGTTAVAGARSRLLLRALRMWRSATAVRKACGSAAATATTKATTGTAKRALALWRRHAQWMIARRYRVSTSAEVAQLRLKRNGLLTWSAYVARQVDTGLYSFLLTYSLDSVRALCL
jgi:hypothetical protein